METIVSPPPGGIFRSDEAIEFGIQMDTGVPALILFYWDDGSGLKVLERTIDEVDPLQVYKFNHSYTSDGMKNVTVEARNAQGALIGVANFQTASVEIEIQHPVENNWNLTISSGLTSGIVLLPPVWETIQNITMDIRYVLKDGILRPGYGASGSFFPLRSTIDFTPLIGAGVISQLRLRLANGTNLFARNMTDQFNPNLTAISVDFPNDSLNSLAHRPERISIKKNAPLMAEEKVANITPGQNLIAANKKKEMTFLGGNYSVVLEVYNIIQGWIESPFYEIYIDPFIPITNLTIISPTADSMFASGEEIEVSIKMDSGAPALIYIFWDDGVASVLETTIEMVDPAQLYKFNHSYTLIGKKNVTVEVRNAQGALIGVANFQTASVEIEILDPVQNNWNLSVSSGLTSGIVLVPPDNGAPKARP
ncbi:unnamed protein product [Darwinula stevensoni]|uniref:Uncharacterized protein n=1 Tax=Darwinula stevensoni TaxID=69355 RepID=A0A7R8X9S0_9CRUS|nr:unnamed protein product [Darwinula stevensoni]CAG0889440.1 unnamed protein product [Darwinula stevensoni]